jgi:hypothetical protein
MDQEKQKHTHCHKCHSGDLVWRPTAKVADGKCDGKLSLADISMVFELQCTACSEVLQVLNCEAVAEWISGLFVDLPKAHGNGMLDSIEVMNSILAVGVRIR